MKLYLATLLYIAPEGTYPEGETPRVQTYSTVGDFENVFGFIEGNFDGVETIQSKEQEAIDSLERDGEWQLDDSSAGQWVTIIDIEKKDSIIL